MASRCVVLLVIALAAAGCGGGDRRAATEVRGALDLEGDGARASTALLRVTGRVTPATARVVFEDADRVRLARGNVARDGRFVAVLPDLPIGTTTFAVTATAPGAEPWKTEVAVTRARARGRAVAAERAVPPDDRTPPGAVLLLADGVRTVSSVAPVRDDADPPVELAGPELTLTAITSDADGATGRIRASLTYEQLCPGDEPRMQTRHFPPSEIASVRIAPGTPAPIERWRVARVLIDRGGSGCSARGEAWADATNASGLETFSDQVRFVFDRR